MVLTIVPLESGYVKNFQLVGEGGIFDSTKCLYRQGTWVNNKLNGESVYTDFLNPIVNIKVGPYVSNKPDGTISEYTFDKTSWDAFILNSITGIEATKKINVYVAGILSSTTSTETINITGNTDTNLAGNVINFSFSEVV